ncbi:MAG: tetratricopeptide repeat protein [Gammaproteobacteria bacterium]|nr:tetratricopeptide repeat protein [Gammaproteobacteria bacterium]
MLNVYKGFVLLSALLLTACATTQPQLEGRPGTDFTIDELKQRAEMASYAGAHRDALLQYQQILDKEPDNVEALIGAGEALLAAEQHLRAENYFERALKIEPMNLQAREARALSWLMSGKYSAAQKSLLNMVDDGIERWRMWNALGVVADVFGDYSAAVAYYKRALLLEPRSATLLNNLGYSMMMAHQYVDAEATLREALVSAPGDLRAVNNLSLSIAWQGRYADAIEQLTGVMDAAAANNNIGYVAYLRADYLQAKEFFKKAIRLRPVYYVKAAKNLEMVNDKLLRQ